MESMGQIVTRESISALFARADSIDGESGRCPRKKETHEIRDVLQRHQAVHDKDATEAKSSTHRPRERAIEACETCATSKLSCDNERPCQVRNRNASLILYLTRPDSLNSDVSQNILIALQDHPARLAG